MYGEFSRFFRIFALHIDKHGESVSLFPWDERRKFIWMGNGHASCRVVSVFCGYRRGSCCLF